MSAVTPVPPFKSFSPSMRVDAFLGDWRANLPVELTAEEREAQLYGEAWKEYLTGDYGFGLWCWHETDRLTNSFGGSVKEVTRCSDPVGSLDSPIGARWRRRCRSSKSTGPVRAR